MALKFYTGMAKRLKLKTKSQKVFGANSYFSRSYRKKLSGGGDFLPPILNRVKVIPGHTGKQGPRTLKERCRPRTLKGTGPLIISGF